MAILFLYICKSSASCMKYIYVFFFLNLSFISFFLFFPHTAQQCLLPWPTYRPTLPHRRKESLSELWPKIKIAILTLRSLLLCLWYLYVIGTCWYLLSLCALHPQWLGSFFDLEQEESPWICCLEPKETFTPALVRTFSETLWCHSILLKQMKNSQTFFNTGKTR